MKSVIAELEQGSKWDSRMLLFGALFVIAAFLSIYDTELWNSNNKLFLPLLIAGLFFVALNIFQVLTFDAIDYFSCVDYEKLFRDPSTKAFLKPG